jgi:DNA-binding transcriptional MerR regulator
MTSKRSLAEAPQEERASLQIGEVAERTGVTQRTLRFYEEKGLLKPPSRLEGGFRLYSEEDIERVERIKRMQTLLGLSLADIKEMVEAEEVKLQIKATYRRDAQISERKAKMRKAIEVTEHQASIIEQKLAALQEMKDLLDDKLGQYRGWLEHLEEQERTLART